MDALFGTGEGGEEYSSCVKAISLNVAHTGLMLMVMKLRIFVLVQPGRCPWSVKRVCGLCSAEQKEAR